MDKQTTINKWAVVDIIIVLLLFYILVYPALQRQGTGYTKNQLPVYYRAGTEIQVSINMRIHSHKQLMTLRPWRLCFAKAPFRSVGVTADLWMKHIGDIN